jgi:hypothetical protein
MTSSGITAQEPEQSPVLVFSIPSRKRECVHQFGSSLYFAELASVDVLLIKGLDHSNLPTTLELACDVSYLLHAHIQTKFRKCKFSRTHIDGTHAHTHTHTHTQTQTPTQKHRNTTPSES